MSAIIPAQHATLDSANRSTDSSAIWTAFRTAFEQSDIAAFWTTDSPTVE